MSQVATIIRALVAMDVQSLSDLQSVSYVDVACLSLLSYDTLLNINQEDRHIWRSKWGLIKCLYLWTRYSTFIDTILAVRNRFQRVVNSPSCRSISGFDTSVGIGITAVILMVRTYALYGRSKRLLVFFAIMWLLIGGVDMWALLRYTESFKPVADSPVSSPIGVSCDVDSSSNIVLVCLVSLLVGETVVVLLTLWKGLYTFFPVGSTGQQSHLVTTFYRDGILFYLAILLIFIIDVVLQRAARPGLQDIADT
ncbi:hypothetical protein DFH07DRAFT_559404 [Mycena maculata]|uniref:DUF6533 domain-containing protein n=1 Tax=Mycena maculata TaxID=230809 RepID=A0AAD7ITF6_9AGAR|nr:hypothetical protein DFH07DRAFT_559404 [Mycena maculata]